MNISAFLYTATDIAHPLVGGELPQKGQYAFLEWLRDRERLFLQPEWRIGDDGFRKMLLDVQNAVAYLVDQKAFEAERRSVEDEGGILPGEIPIHPAWLFLKKLRLEMALSEYLKQDGADRRRMKCRTILKRCGVQRRSDVFCAEFELAAAFYHIGLLPAGEKESLLAIDDFLQDEHLFLIRL